MPHVPDRRDDEVPAAQRQFDLEVKLAVYRHFTEQARRPAAEDVARLVSAAPSDVLSAFHRLATQRLLVLENTADIRMAPPFSGVPTQHVAEIDGRRYFANCAWDVLGIAAAMHQPATVRSRCEQSGEPYVLEVSVEGPGPSDWIFHCAVPAAHWWDDVVFT